MVDIALPTGQVLQIPTDDVEEAKRIAALYYNKNKDSLTSAQTTETTVNEPKEIDRSGVDNTALRRFLARAENDAEYELRLQDAGFTEEMYSKDPEGVGYIINRDKLTPELREKYEIEGSGLLSVEDKGISYNDFAEFFAGNRGAIIGGTAASLAATGFGAPLAMLIAGGGSAAGYLLDEGLEYTGGLQAQSSSDVARQAGLELAFGLVGEGVGRGISAGFARLIKGPGNKTANAARAEARQMIAQGARPTVRATNTAPIMGRMQAIYEGVFPNEAAAKKNAEFIGQQIKAMKESRSLGDDVDYENIMDVINRDITRIYGTPDQLVKQAEKNLTEVVDKQIAGVVNLMGKPDARGGKVVAEALDIAKRTFDEDVNDLFARANEMLGKEKIVDVSSLRSAATTIIEENPALELGEKGFFKYVVSMPDAVDVQTANSLRTALNHASFDPSIVGSVDSQLLNKLNSALANSFKKTEAIARTISSKPGSIRGADGKFIGKQKFQNMSEGFDMLRKAQNFYNKGVDRFKQPLTEKVYQHYMTGKNFNPNDLLDPKFGIITPNNARGLNRFLNTVVPSGKAGKVVPQSLKDVVPDLKVTLPTGQEGNMIELVEQLPADDALRRYYDSMLIDQQRFAQRIGQARGQGVEIRKATRRQLAGMYLTRMFDESRDLMGNIDAAKVAESINALGDTKKALFREEEKQLMDALSDMAAMGKNVTPEQLSQFAGRPITDQLAAVNQLTQASKELRGLPLLQQLERAALEQDPNKILNAVLKKNGAAGVKAATQRLDKETMDVVRDLAMRKIISSAGDPSMQNGEDFVKAVFEGTHAKAFQKQLDAYGRETLSALFGKETTDGLYNLANYSLKASNDPIKGLGGLAPAVIASSLGVAGMIAAPFATLSKAAVLSAMSKLLRSEAYLKLISRPTGGRPKGTPGIDYDQLGNVLETIHRLVGQQMAAGVSSGVENTSVAAQRVQEAMPEMPTASTMAPAPRTSAPAPTTTRGVPGRVQTQIRSNPQLLGGDPYSQAVNAEIARRLQLSER
jgi:hypothetical protein